MVIVTGPNQELAIKLIKRMKALFEEHGLTFDSKETVLELNGCTAVVTYLYYYEPSNRRSFTQKTTIDP